VASAKHNSDPALALLAVRAKGAMNARLRLAPAAEVFTWLAPKRRQLGHIESACADIVASWTLGRGEQWTPLGGIALRQFVTGVGLAFDQGSARTVTRSIEALTAKGIVGHWKRGVGRQTWYRLLLVDEILRREHQHQQVFDLGREDADQVIADLQTLDAQPLAVLHQQFAGLLTQPLAAPQQQSPNGGPSVSEVQTQALANLNPSVSEVPTRPLAAGKQHLSRTLSFSHEVLSEPGSDALSSRDRRDDDPGCLDSRGQWHHAREDTCDLCRGRRRPKEAS